MIGPYGGGSYAISRGMTRAIGRDRWAECMYKHQCNNADIRVMVCIFEAGYMVTNGFSFPTLQHHVRSVEQMNYLHDSYSKVENVSLA